MKFWDASAIVPIVIDEPPREVLLAILERDTSMVVWWGTPVECVSAIARREREGALTPASSGIAIERLRTLSTAWQEVQPFVSVRDLATRLLRVHPLRAADSLQLAAATIAAEHQPPTMEFVCLDERLAIAAGREGFRVVTASRSS